MDMRLSILREMFAVCWTRSELIVRISSAIPWVARLRRNSSVNFRSGSPALYSAPRCVAVVVRFMHSASVLRVMRDLDGLGPEEIARRIWKVTYSPRYLAENTEKIEGQMLREIAEPTPLHAADLQFQAFSDFDCSDALPNVRAPTLVLTGDLDQLIPPGNSKTLAKLIPGAELRILRGIAHRLMWEAAQDCAHVVSDFLREVDSERRALVPGTRLYSPAESSRQDNPLTLFVKQWQEALELAARWPLVLNDFASDFMIHVLQPLYFGRRPRIGDGKPIVIVAEDAINRMAVTPFATWLSGIGFRPMMANFAPQDGWLRGETLRETIRCAAERTGRKAIVIALDASLESVVHAAASEPAHVCAIVALAPSIHHGPVPDKLHVHLITTQDDFCSTIGEGSSRERLARADCNQPGCADYVIRHFTSDPN